MNVAGGLLQSSDPYVQQQGIIKLYKEILAEAETNKPVVKSDFYRLMIDQLSSENGLLASCAGHALLSLIKASPPAAAGLRSHVVQALLSALTADRNFDVLVAFLGDVVISAAAVGADLTALDGETEVAADGNLHARVLRAVCHRWSLVVADVARMLAISSKLTSQNTLLEYCLNFFGIVIHSALPGVSSLSLHLHLLSVVCQHASLTQSLRPLIRVLTELVSYPMSFCDSVLLFRGISNHLFSLSRQSVSPTDIPSAACISLTYALYMQVKRGVRVSSLTCNQLMTLIDLGHGGSEDLALLTQCLYHVPAVSLAISPLLRPIGSLLACGRCSPFLACLLIPPLSLAIDVLPSLSHTLSPLIQSAMACSSEKIEGSSPHVPVDSELCNILCCFDPVLVEVKLAAQVFSHTQGRMIWLKRLAKVLPSVGDIGATQSLNPAPTILTARCLAALICCSLTSSAERCFALSLVGRLVSVLRDCAGDIYTAIVHRLNTETEPRVCHLLLHTLPALTVSKSIVPKLVHLLSRMYDHRCHGDIAGTLSPEAIGVLCASWRAQPRCLPYLSALLRVDSAEISTLATPAPDTDVVKLTSRVAAESCWAVKGRTTTSLLAKLHAIAEICRHDPDSGSQHIGTLSRVLSQLSVPVSLSSGKAGIIPPSRKAGISPPPSVSDDSVRVCAADVACGLVLEAITLLCQQQRLDVRSAWAILAPIYRLSQHHRYRLYRFIEFTAAVPRLSVGSDEYRVFSGEVATLLWRHVFSSCSVVAKAAMRSLCEFRAECFQPEMFPDKVRGSCRLIEDNSVDQVGSSVPGEYYIAVMRKLPVELLTEFSQLLAALVHREVQTLPRHIYFTAQQRSKSALSDRYCYLSSSSLLRVLVETVHQLIDQLNRSEPDTTPLSLLSNIALLNCCLTPLARKPSREFPPLDFTFLLRLIESASSLAIAQTKNSGGVGVSGLERVAEQCVAALCQHSVSQPSAANALSAVVSRVEELHEQRRANPASRADPDLASVATDKLFEFLPLLLLTVAPPPGGSGNYTLRCLINRCVRQSEHCRVVAVLSRTLADTRIVGPARAIMVDTVETLLRRLVIDQSETSAATSSDQLPQAREQFETLLASVAALLPAASLDGIYSDICQPSEKRQLWAVSAVCRQVAALGGDNQRWLDTLIDAGLTDVITDVLLSETGPGRGASWLSRLIVRLRETVQCEDDAGVRRRRFQLLMRVLLQTMAEVSPLASWLSRCQLQPLAVPALLQLLLNSNACWRSRLAQMQDFLRWSRNHTDLSDFSFLVFPMHHSLT